MISKERNYTYDLIRTLSCICIIFIHTTGVFLDYPKDSAIFLVGNFIQAVVRIGLPMFVVLSGALILNSKEEKLNQFYYKRFVKIVIPFYIYYLIYIFMDNNYSFTVFYPNNLIMHLKTITEGPSIHVHCWFVYMILGIYMCAPFLKKMCKNMNDKELTNLFFLICIILIIKDFLPSIGLKIGLTEIPFYGWIIYFLLGYIFTNDELILKHYKLFYALGIISFIFTLLDVRYSIIGLKGIYDLSITMMLMTMAVFVFFTHLNLKYNDISKKILKFTSKYSWEVYLVHCILIYVIMDLKEKYHILIINKVFTNLLFNISVIILSFLAAFIIHNLLINIAQKIAYKIDKLTFKILKD